MREAAQAAGFGAIAEPVADASRPTVVVDRRMLRRAPRALGTSRFGGRPDLPSGQRWPQCAGQPQTFLGQLRLRDLPPAARDLRRHGGWLLVFTAVEFEDPGFTRYGLWAGRCTTVIHAPASTPLVRRERPRSGPTMPLRPARMRFRARPDVPDTSDDFTRLAAPLSDLSLPSDRVEAWWDMRFALRQADLASEHRVLGYLDTPNGGNRCWNRTLRRRGAWRHLLTVGSDSAVRFDVADAGRLQIAIRLGPHAG